jgi:hypothetical protein
MMQHAPRTASKQRFAIHSPVLYRSRRPQADQTVKQGVVIAISSQRVWMEIDEVLEPGEPLEVYIPWPVLLNARVPLQLQITGTVTEFDGRIGVITIGKYEFKTVPRIMKADAAAGS